MKKDALQNLFEHGLSPVEIRDLPAPIKLTKLVGPGVLMFAVAIGAGEIYIWPWLIAKYSMSLLWLGLLSLYFQYILNTEFARYTLATGETVITGFSRIWKPAGYLFFACSLLPWIWPAWSFSAATIINKHLLPWKFPKDKYAAIALLVLTGVVLSGTTKIFYKTVELLQKVQVIFILVATAILTYFFVDWKSIMTLEEGLIAVPDKVPTSAKDIAFLASAIAFCGAGGTVNLAISNWVRDKKLGMSAFVPQLQKLFRGKRTFKSNDGFFFEGSEENLQKWSSWWQLIKTEQLWTFLFLELICVILLIVLSISLMPNKAFGADLGLIDQEAQVISETLRTGGKTLFYLMITFVLTTSVVGVLDHVARLAADILRNNIKRIKRSKKAVVNEGIIYTIVLWVVIIFGVTILSVYNFQSSFLLLAITGSLSIYVMFLYSFFIFVLHLKLERQVRISDPRFQKFNPFKMSRWRKIMLLFAIAYYGMLSFYVLRSLIK